MKIMKSGITYSIHLQDDFPGPPFRPFFENSDKKPGLRQNRRVEPLLLPVKACDFSFGCVLTLFNFLRQNIYLVVRGQVQSLFMFFRAYFRLLERNFLICTQDSTSKEEAQIKCSPCSHSLHS